MLRVCLLSQRNLTVCFHFSPEKSLAAHQQCLLRPWKGAARHIREQLRHKQREPGERVSGLLSHLCQNSFICRDQAHSLFFPHCTGEIITYRSHRKHLFSPVTPSGIWRLKSQLAGNLPAQAQHLRVFWHPFSSTGCSSCRKISQQAAASAGQEARCADHSLLRGLPTETHEYGIIVQEAVAACNKAVRLKPKHAVCCCHALSMLLPARFHPGGWSVSHQIEMENQTLNLGNTSIWTESSGLSRVFECFCLSRGSWRPWRAWVQIWAKSVLISAKRPKTKCLGATSTRRWSHYGNVVQQVRVDCCPAGIGADWGKTKYALHFQRKPSDSNKQIHSLWEMWALHELLTERPIFIWMSKRVVNNLTRTSNPSSPQIIAYWFWLCVYRFNKQELRCPTILLHVGWLVCLPVDRTSY